MGNQKLNLQPDFATGLFVFTFLGISLAFLLGCSSLKKEQSVESQSTKVRQDSDSSWVVLINEDSIKTALADSKKLGIMIEAGVGGTISLNIYVDSDAQYLRYEVVKSPHPLSTEAVVDLIPFMRFKINKGEDFTEEGTYRKNLRFKYTTY